MKIFVATLILSLLPTFSMAKSQTCQGYMNQQASRAINQLGFKIASTIYKPGENLNYSPISTSAAMQMAVMGATGVNKVEMMSVMGLDDQTLTSGYQSLVKVLNSEIPEITEYKYIDGNYQSVTYPAYEFNLSNAFWVNNNYVLNTEFANLVQMFYQAEATSIPFNDEGVGIINDNISLNTGGKITNLISELDADNGRLVLTNAIRIVALWQQPFTEMVDKPFYQAPGQTAVVQTMVTDDSGLYIPMIDDANVTALSLKTKGEDAGGNSIIQMHIIMPKIKSVGQLLADADEIERIIAALRQSRPNPTYIEMPTFKINNEDPISLVDAFKALGMQRAFSNQMGNFDFMLTGRQEPLQITDILQKAVIEVGLNGFEAEAATAVIMGLESAAMSAERSAFINQPFIYVVENSSGQVNYFVGVVNNPAE